MGELLAGRASVGATASLRMKGSAELEVIIVIKDGGDRFSVQMQMLSWFPVIDVFPVPMQWCVEFFLKSERPAGSSLLFLNPFPR